MRDFEIASSEDCNMMKNGMRPVHPGEILREEYLAPMGMSVHALEIGRASCRERV